MVKGQQSQSSLRLRNVNYFFAGSGMQQKSFQSNVFLMLWPKTVGKHMPKRCSHRCSCKTLHTLLALPTKTEIATMKPLIWPQVRRLRARKLYLLMISSQRLCQHAVVLHWWRWRPQSFIIGHWNQGHILLVPKQEGYGLLFARIVVVLPLASKTQKPTKANLFTFSWRMIIQSFDDLTG